MLERRADDRDEVPVAADIRARHTIRRNPLQLLRVFTVGSAIGMLAIVALVGAGVHRIYYAHILRHAEVNAIQVSQALFEQEREQLTIGAAPALAVPPETIPRLDERMRRYLRPLEIVKIKVFAPDGTVVYSTDHGIIGKVDAGNRRLARALAGEADSSMKTTDRLADLVGEQRFDIDVVETYVPIRHGDRIIGAFETYTNVTWSRNEILEVLALSVVIVSVVLLAIFGVLYVLMRALTRELIDAERELEQMAITDPLTGLANRRYVISRADEECLRVSRLGDKGVTGGVGFIMADIDHFKDVNDGHGHLAGDRVLREVAARLRRATRRYDVVGRYGGEEFLVLLPQTDADETRAVAERIWQVMREQPIVVGDLAVRVTISVGVASITPGDADLAMALKRADDALYLAKAAGRDRVAVA